MSNSFRTSTFRRFALVASVSGIALSLATPTFAQSKPAADENEASREIVVTAQFREQKLQDTPLSITAIDAKLLESRNQTDLSQIARQAPNVTLNAMGGAYGSSLGASIRGIGQFDFNPAYEPGVGMYVDDVYYATLTGGIFDLLDLERVEVLRGPQGTLTGRNSIGGAIKLFSKKPTDENSGAVEALYGSRKRINLRGSANFVLGEGLYGRVSGVFKRQDGYIDQIDYGCKFPGNTGGISPTTNVNIPAMSVTSPGCVVAKLGEVNYSGVRGALRYNPSDKFDLTVSADYTHEDHTSAGEVGTRALPITFFLSPLIGKTPTSVLCGPYCSYASFYAPAGGQVAAAYNTPNRVKYDGWGISANMTIGLNDDLNLQSITAYRQYRTIWGTDDDFSPDPAIVASGYNDLKFHFFSEEMRLNGKVGDNVDFTLGGFYSDQKSVYYTRQDIRYFGSTQFIGNDPVRANSKAVFGTVIVRPMEALTLTGGLRYTSEHKDYTFSRKNYDGTVSSALGSLDGVVAKFDGNKVDWRVSADYRFSPEVLAYVTVGTGFKGGGVTARPFDAAQALNGSFGAETVTAYEAGLKTDLFDRRLRLNISAFINDYKGIQLPLISCASLGSNAPCGARQNAGDGKVKGFEVEMSASPAQGFDIDASLSHLTGNYNRIDTRVGNAVLLTDPIVSPKWKWSIGAQYKADLGDSGSITPRIDASYTGKASAGRIVNGGPIEYYDSYTLANARLTWKNKAEDLQIALEVQNLFNEYYTPFRFAAVAQFTGTIYSQVGRPREWAVSVKKTF
jgi:iron complex outermembrane recepter protein